MDPSRFKQLSLAEQMGNIGSELARMQHWENLGDPHQREKAFFRALELIDLTLSDSRWQKRLKEIARLREVVCDCYCGQKIYHAVLKDIVEYCTNFAIYARRRLKVTL